MIAQKYDKFPLNKADNDNVASPAVKTNKRMPRVYIIGNDKGVRSMFYKNGYECTSRDTTEYHMAVFTGGSDVTPFLYGQKMLSQRVYCDPERDMDEVRLFHTIGGDVPDFPKIGICRGAQFLNVMSGGTLWQDVNNHFSIKGILVHDMFEISKDAKKPRIIPVTSTHHQMMVPGSSAQVVCKAFLSTIKEDDERKLTIEKPMSTEGDAEVIYYWNTGSLCFQGHPEYETSPECTKYFFELLEHFYESTYKTVRGENKVKSVG